MMVNKNNKLMPREFDNLIMNKSEILWKGQIFYLFELLFNEIQLLSILF